MASTEKKVKLAIITISDSRSASPALDRSGSVIKELTADDYETIFYQVIPDNFETIKATLIEACRKNIPLILTTGGTGLAPRDQTPEATKEIIEKEVPGISEAMRHHSAQFTPLAMLSRGVSGIRGNSLIINLPGSPKAAKENLSGILPVLHHALDVLSNSVRECGSDPKIKSSGV